MVNSGNRDEALERLLRRALARPGEAQGEACPEADVLGAYLEQRLPAAEASAFEAHAADCARCQQVLALIAEMPPVTPTLALAPASGDERASARWWQWSWLVPAAAAAALSVALFVALRPEPPASEVAGGVEVSQAPLAQAPTMSAPAEVPAGGAAESRRAASAERDAAPPSGLSPEAPFSTPAATPAPPPAPRASTGGVRPPAGSSEEGAARDLARQAAKASPPVVPPPAGQDASRASPAVRSQPFATQQAQHAEQAQRAEQAAAAPQAAERFAPAPKVAENTAPAPVPVVAGAVAGEVAPPPQAAPAAAEARRMSDAVGGRAAALAPAAGLVRWRVGAAGSIERTSDGGRSWRRQDAGVRADLLAAATVSPTAAWAVGAAGTVLLTSDGERWERRPFPEATDLVAVSATHVSHATVTARDGRRFATTDGGRTWQPVR